MRSFLALLALLAALPSIAGELSREDIERRFRPPLHVGAKLRDVPAWPLTSELEPDSGPVGYVFESVDLAPIPGFEGSPIDLLIAIDRKGNFIDVELLHQHEPVFLSGLGEAPLRDFLHQYAGLSLTRGITVSTLYGDRSASRQRTDDGPVVLDGVSKATASIRIVNQTALTAAHAVARARLGFAAPATKAPPATVRADAFERIDFAALIKGGHIAHLHATEREVEALFANSDAAGLDPHARSNPDGSYIDLYVAYLNAPTIGRAILGDAGHAALMKQLEPGQHAYWIATAGRDTLVDDSFVRGTVPPRLSLVQDGVSFELRDLDLAPAPPTGAPPLNAALVLRTPPLSGLDPGRSQHFEFELARSRGEILPVVTRRDLAFDYAPPQSLFTRPPAPLPDWLIAWRERTLELGILGAALLLLAIVLARPRWISVSPVRLRRFRIGYLAFTLGFIGWYAQGQLSVVQITGAVKTLVAGQSLASFLYDPVSLLLIAFTFASFLIWGRGTFCGWLCPFGALQEFVAIAARRLHLPQFNLPARLARLLDGGRYLILALLVASAAFAPALAERLVEIEPFKTAITVGFIRTLPFVIYAVALLAAGAFCYKFFCRYLCPLGAAMTLGGKLRRLDWLTRRSECGRPCQRCRHACSYEAIARDGAIRYDNCFQCLDCVGIYHDGERCAPVLLYRRKGRRLVPAPLAK